MPAGRPEVVAQGVTVPGSKLGTQLIRQRRVKKTARVVATSNVVISTLGDGDTVDGVVINQNDRVFLQAETAGKDNGIYDAGPAGGPSVRSPDFDNNSEVKAGVEVFVSEGTAEADTNWVLITDDPIVVDTTVLVFIKMPVSPHTHGRPDLPSEIAYEDELNTFTLKQRFEDDLELNDQDGTPVADRRMRIIDGLLRITDVSQVEGRNLSRLSIELLTNAEIAAAAGIVESKLTLNFPTHDNVNDPTAGEKAALPGTSGAPGAGNKYVTDADARMTDARAPTVHAFAGADHSASTFAALLSKVSDAGLIKTVRLTDDLDALVAAAVDNDQFVLEPGVHTVNAVVTLSKKRVKIWGPRGAKVQGDDSGLAQIFRITADDCVLEGFEILSPANDGHCVRVDGAANLSRVRLENLHMSKAARTTVGNGIFFTVDATFKLDDMKVIGCTFDMTNLEAGIETGSISAPFNRPHFVRNKFIGIASSAFAQYAIRTQFSGAGIIGCLIADNDIDEAVTAGIKLGAGSRGRIIRNHILSPGGGRMDDGIVSGVGGILICQNTIADCSANGISVTGRATINDNDIDGCPTGIRNTSGNSRWKGNSIRGFVDPVINTGSAGTESDSSDNIMSLSAAQFDDPNNADWKVNGLAPAIADDNNNGLTVRKFVDAAEKGVGLEVDVPVEATRARFTFFMRQEDATPAAGNVVLKFYEREVVAGAVTGTWSTGFTKTLTPTFPADEKWVESTVEESLTTFGLVRGQVHQMQITRDGANGSDTLAAPMYLKLMRVTFI